MGSCCDSSSISLYFLILTFHFRCYLTVISVSLDMTNRGRGKRHLHSFSLGFSRGHLVLWLLLLTNFTLSFSIILPKCLCALLHIFPNHYRSSLMMLIFVFLDFSNRQNMVLILFSSHMGLRHFNYIANCYFGNMDSKHTPPSLSRCLGDVCLMRAWYSFQHLLSETH